MLDVKYCLDNNESFLQTLNYLRKIETEINYEILNIHLRCNGRSIYLFSLSHRLQMLKKAFFE